MPLIRVLKEETINQIAAGEVIENPASVVKELVENSIDAGSSYISISIKGGGFLQIRVSDDGVGMDADDAVLCFERHATSKISRIDDLSSLVSMGFRGEALASIASISHVDLVTAKENGLATHVSIQGGKIHSVEPASRKKGTTFEIKSLFFNVPARKKFQKNPSAAVSEIHRLMIHFAIGLPEIGFELISNEDPLLKLPSAKGKDFLEKLKTRLLDLTMATQIPLLGIENGYQLQGFIGKTSDHRPNRLGQYLFVNRRSVFSPLVSYAVKEGYGHRLDEKRYPIFILHLEVEPSLIDVNVHPQKKEIRFQENEFLKTFIKNKVHASFGQPEIKAENIPTKTSVEIWDAPLKFREEQESHTTFLQEHVIGLFHNFLLLDASTVGGYEPGIVWVDLQKAQQCLICHQLCSDLESISQNLLFPMDIVLNQEEIHLFSLKETELKAFGFSAHICGKQSLLIEAIPSFLDMNAIEETVRLILQSNDTFLNLSEKVATIATGKKKKFMLQEALTLWRNLKTLNLSQAIAWTGMHVIEKFFR